MWSVRRNFQGDSEGVIVALDKKTGVKGVEVRDNFSNSGIKALGSRRGIGCLIGVKETSR